MRVGITVSVQCDAMRISCIFSQVHSFGSYVSAENFNEQIECNLFNISHSYQPCIFICIFFRFVNLFSLHVARTEKPYRLAHVKHKLRNQRSVRDVIHLRLNNNDGMLHTYKLA